MQHIVDTKFFQNVVTRPLGRLANAVWGDDAYSKLTHAEEWTRSTTQAVVGLGTAVISGGIMGGVSAGIVKGLHALARHGHDVQNATAILNDVAAPLYVAGTLGTMWLVARNWNNVGNVHHRAYESLIDQLPHSSDTKFQARLSAE